MEKEDKIREYLRKLSKKEIEELQLKYEIHIKRSRGGFLERPIKEKLLRYKKLDQYATTDDISKDFWEIREHAKTAIGDLLLLTDTLTESQLKEILLTQPPKDIMDSLSKNPDTKAHDRVWQSNPRLENVLRSILKDRDFGGIYDKKEWDKKELSEQEDAWKFFMVQTIIEICFDFLKNNSYVTTKAHERLVEEVIDMINSESRNTRIPRVHRKTTWV